MRKLPFALIIIYTCFFFSCGKNKFQPGSNGNTQQTTATIFGQVFDEAGDPVQDAIIRTGTKSCKTDSQGVFSFLNITTSLDATILEVSKAGYFKGYRNMLIIADEDNYTRIMLMEKKNPVQFQSATGATVNMPGNASIVYPPNSIVNKSTGMVYNGEVKAYTAWIDPSRSKLGEMVPGSLKGMNTLGQEKLLESYGMILTELVDMNDQPLAMGAGMKAQVSLPVPAGLSGNAPQQVPLWNFDETLATWVEEDTANLQGGNYVGNVNVTGFLNVDFPYAPLQFTLHIKDQQGQPLSNVIVRMSNAVTHAAGNWFSNSQGKVRGRLPANASMILEVYDNNCYELLYTKTFQTANSDLTMDDLTITIPIAKLLGVNGTVTECSNNPASNAFLKISGDNFFKVIKVPPSGIFNNAFYACVDPLYCSVIVEDLTHEVYGLYQNIVLHPGANNLGVLTACGNSTKQYISWTSTVNGVNSNFYIEGAIETFYTGNTDTGTVLSAWTGLTGQISINLLFTGPPTASGAHFLYQYVDHLEVDTVQMITHKVPVYIPMIITRFDPVGGMIEGSFDGQINFGVMIPKRHIKGNFRVKRHG